MDGDQGLRVSLRVLARRIEEVRESVPRHKVELSHVLLILRRLAHARHPHLSQFARVLTLDVAPQLRGHLLRQLVHILEVVGQPIGLRVKVEEHAHAAIGQTVTGLFRACSRPVLQVYHAELAGTGDVIEVARNSVGGVIGKEFWRRGRE